MTVNEKVVQQEEEAKQAAAAAEPGEHLHHLSGYNKRPNLARYPN